MATHKDLTNPHSSHLLIILTVMLCLCTNMQAQDDSTKVAKKKNGRKIELYGEVYDSFTKAKVKAFMEVMRTDSTVVDTMTCWTWGTNSYYDLKVPAENADYIIHATADGYEDAYLNYQLRHIARNSSFKLPRILMKKKSDDVWREYDLNGVEVKGTRVKIAYRGDTLVYNASAFNLPEGSMLDGLISQMPGAELKDNGDIYINGRKIDYLTLNGKDFYKGQNKVMLDNLPYFTVKELKVYDKRTKNSEMAGRDIEAKEYVMDVQLKREYSRGYMANIEAGGGTEHRYMARMFALYYDDHSRISVFGNTNNVNETRRPGGEGEWSPSNMPQGLRKTRQAGIDINTEDKDKNIEEELSATLEWSDADDWSRTSSETFATDGNIFRGSETKRQQKDFRFSARNQFRLNKPIQLNSYITVDYNDGKANTSSQDSTYRQYLINQTQSAGLNKYRTLNTSAMLYWMKKFDWGDYISILFNGNYFKQKPNEQFRRTNISYHGSDTNDLRDFYTDTHSNSYNYQTTVNYALQFPNQWFVEPAISYSQGMRNRHNSNYRLDWLGDTKSNAANADGTTYDPYHQLGWLPSSYETLMSTLDDSNSNNSQNLTRTVAAEVEVQHSTDQAYLTMGMKLSRSFERMHYIGSGLDTIAHRNYTQFEPSLTFYNWASKKGIRYIYYNMSISRPDMASLMPTTNNTNPLSVRLNNPNLKPQTQHNLALHLEFNNDSLKHFLSLWSSLSISQNNWGTRTTYNEQTGGYTYRNENINGNWGCNIGENYQIPIDKRKLLTFKQKTEVNYYHSVDFDIAYTTAAAQRHSTVNNWTLNERLEIEYQKDKLTASVMGSASWRRSTGDRQNFEAISAFDYEYGGRLMYTIPWVRLSLATDIKMFSRRGYNSSMMNTDDLVWNAELSRPLLKERMTLKLTAFDLLHQLSNKQYSVNAQGRTETWTNCIPRYVMLTVAYKFTRKPKQ